MQSFEVESGVGNVGGGRRGSDDIITKTTIVFDSDLSYSGYLAYTTKEVLFGSKLNILMLITPLAVLGDWLGWSDGFMFVSSLLAIAPFAERLGYVTEQLAMHTNDTLGGLLNATFGNATEIIISIFAMLKGRTGIPENDNPRMYQRLVQVSLLGSVLSNLLLVLGSALIVGGIRYREQEFNKMGTSVSTALLFLACGAIASPMVMQKSEVTSQESNLMFSRFVSAELVFVYALFLAFQLKTHRHYYEEDPAPRRVETMTALQSPVMDHRFSSVHSTTGADMVGTGAISDMESAMVEPPPSPSSLNVTTATSRIRSRSPSRSGGGSAIIGSDDESVTGSLPPPITLKAKQSAHDSDLHTSDDDDDDEDELILGFRLAIVWLALISVIISVLSEYLVGAIKGAAQVYQVPKEFIEAILIPVVGNAAEHASALVFAYRNKMDITVGIALGSATQISVGVLPLCVLIGWPMGTPLDLVFEPFEALCMIISCLTVGVMLRDGKSHWLYGVILICAYFIIAAGYWTHI